MIEHFKDVIKDEKNIYLGEKEKIELSNKEIYSFWDKELENEYSMTESELIDLTWGCSEEQFGFEFTISDDVSDIIKQINSDNWGGMDVQEKKLLIEDFVYKLGKELEIENLPQINLDKDRDGCYGYYSEYSNTIFINEKYLNEPKELINTLAHEIRHAYQAYRADIFETKLDELYKYNFENYISVKEDENGYVLNFNDYQEQLIEAEARAFANLFTQ